MHAISVGGVFGESSLHRAEADRVRTADVRAGPEGCAVVTLSSADFTRVMGPSFETVASRNYLKHVIASVRLPGGLKMGDLLASSDLYRLVDSLKEKGYAQTAWQHQSSRYDHSALIGRRY